MVPPPSRRRQLRWCGVVCAALCTGVVVRTVLNYGRVVKDIVSGSVTFGSVHEDARVRELGEGFLLARNNYCSLSK